MGMKMKMRCCHGKSHTHTHTHKIYELHAATLLPPFILPILNYEINSACIDFLINLLRFVIAYCRWRGWYVCVCVYVCFFLLHIFSVAHLLPLPWCCCSAYSFWLPLLKSPDIFICTTIIKKKMKILTALVCDSLCYSHLFFPPLSLFLYWLSILHR